MSTDQRRIQWLRRAYHELHRSRARARGDIADYRQCALQHGAEIAETRQQMRDSERSTNLLLDLLQDGEGELRLALVRSLTRNERLLATLRSLQDYDDAVRPLPRGARGIIDTELAYQESVYGRNGKASDQTQPGELASAQVAQAPQGEGDANS